MSGQPIFYILKRRLPAGEGPHLLGRVVQHFQDPGASYTPEKPSEVFELSKILETKETPFLIDAKSTKDDALRSRLFSLLAFNRTSAGEQELHLEAKTVIKRSLTNYKRVFNGMKAVEEVRKELLEMLPRGGKAYMIVGIMAFDRADMKHSGQRSKGRVVKGSAPVAQVAGGVLGVPLPNNSAGRADLESESARSSDWAVQSSTEDEEVFAIEYRVITRDWGGYGNDLEYRDSIPSFQGGLTYHGEDTDDDDDDEDVDFNDTSHVSDKGLSLRTNDRFQGKSPVLDTETGFLYYPDA
ncbi:hypothetical protein B7494_g4953 [Chlorociboria aeruginascens]|nr:hypothetical protein B7494_g4953 [Chlorociboria aeruginascens]